MMIRSAIALSLSFLLFTLACGPRPNIAERKSIPSPKQARITSLVEPAGTVTIPLGEPLRVRLNAPDTISVDSVQFFLGSTLRQTLYNPPEHPLRFPIEITLATGGGKTGNAALRVKVLFAGGRHENHSRQIIFLSDISPVEYSYRVVNAYPHDPGAYTQGLQFEDGWLYEGTGSYGSSSLRRVELETGEVVQVRNLDQSLFGEGITVFGERIYQLTYKSQVGFIYDRTSFRELRKVYYQNREGWGLTNNGRELIMSDGTNVIYFLDPEMFTINRQLEVFHDKGAAGKLNELEYINGKIWANRYYTDEIVIIDPETGKVEGRINLKGILKIKDRKSNTDVLNGIAWDQSGNRIFVTGKYWPKLFEIKLQELQ